MRYSLAFKETMTRAKQKVSGVSARSAGHVNEHKVVFKGWISLLQLCRHFIKSLTVPQVSTALLLR